MLTPPEVCDTARRRSCCLAELQGIKILFFLFFSPISWLIEESDQEHSSDRQIMTFSPLGLRNANLGWCLCRKMQISCQFQAFMRQLKVHLFTSGIVLDAFSHINNNN